MHVLLFVSTSSIRKGRQRLYVCTLTVSTTSVPTRSHFLYRGWTLPLNKKSLLKATIFLSMGAITVKIGSDTELIQ